MNLTFGAEKRIFTEAGRLAEKRPAFRRVVTCPHKQPRFLAELFTEAGGLLAGRGSTRGEPPANFTGLVLGCIEAKFCK